MPAGEDRAELARHLERHLPGAAPLRRYQLFDLPAAVSFGLRDDLGYPVEPELEVVAAGAAQVYELVFAPDDDGWLYVVREAPLRAYLPDEPELDGTDEGRVDGSAFVPAPVEPPDPGRVRRPVRLPAADADADARCTVGAGHSPLDRPAVFDVPDDRFCGVAAAHPDRFLGDYRSGIAPLNEYRRPLMEQVFGFWPDDEGG